MLGLQAAVAAVGALDLAGGVGEGLAQRHPPALVGVGALAGVGGDERVGEARVVALRGAGGGADDDAPGRRQRLDEAGARRRGVDHGDAGVGERRQQGVELGGADVGAGQVEQRRVGARAAVADEQHHHRVVRLGRGAHARQRGGELALGGEPVGAVAALLGEVDDALAGQAQARAGGGEHALGALAEALAVGGLAADAGDDDEEAACLDGARRRQHERQQRGPHGSPRRRR